jgi:hypothetical protein
MRKRTNRLMLRGLYLLSLLCCLSVNTQAHEVRPGYLELRELDPGTWDILWKVPARGDMRLGLYVKLPETCVEGNPNTQFINGAYIERWRTKCSRGLVGETVGIQGLASTRTDVLVRVTHLGDGTQTIRLTPSEPEFSITGKANWKQVASSYMSLGAEHILIGIDHLLFILALLFLVGGWGRLVGTITTFTLAHSLTLAAATLGWVHVPQTPVEAAIALSIVFVAVEILHGNQGKQGLASRMPWVIAFLFGLLHGLGFAGALNQIGLPDHAIPLALAFFNIGVEIGQLVFIAVIFGLVWFIRHLVQDENGKLDTWQSISRTSVPTAYVIGTIAMFWVFERSYIFITW